MWFWQPLPAAVSLLAAKPAASPPLQNNVWHPGRHPGRFFVPPPHRAYPAGASPTTTARGPAIVATLLLEVEHGSRVTYEWDSDITPMYNGAETRRALALVPRESYDFATFLDDAAIRTLLSNLVVNAAHASAFGLALEHESLLVTAPGVGSTVSVPTTTRTDWDVTGQRAIIVAPDYATVIQGVVQSSTANSITLDVSVAAAGTGWRIMPVMPCYLDEKQTLGLYPANAGTYSLRARAAYFGDPNGAWTVSGATVATYTDPFTSQVFPVYDVPMAVEDSSPRAAVAGTMVTDFQGAFEVKRRMASADFLRQILHVIRFDTDRQYLKAFMGACLGRARVFLLPTWKPDLVPASSDASSSVLRVVGAAGATDYAGQWFQSPAQRRLMLWLADGTYAYVNVSSALDNGDGTQSLQLDRGITPGVVSVSFLETCRLDVDQVQVEYDAAGLGRATIPVRVVRQ